MAAAHAVQGLAAVSVPVLPGLAAEKEVGPGLHVEPPVFSLVVLLAFSLVVLPVFLVGQVRELCALAAESDRGQPFHAAGNGIAGCEAFAAAQPVDTDLLNTAAGKRAAGRGAAQNRGSSGPIRVYAVPSHAPSADPSGAVRSTATRESTQEAAGSSSRVYAG